MRKIISKLLLLFLLTSCAILVACNEKQSVVYSVNVPNSDEYEIEIDEFTIENGKISVKEKTEISFIVKLLGLYGESNITVKVNDKTIQADENGKYKYEVTGDASITVENLIAYKVIEDSALFIETDVFADEKASVMSTKTNVYDLDWGNYSFSSLKLAPYASVIFYMKAINEDGNSDSPAWILLTDKKGYYNEKGTNIYANKSPESENDNHVPDGVWHKFELRKETNQSEETYWQLYVDNEKHAQYNDLPVDARFVGRINEMSFTFNTGKYYVSELFGLEDPSYVPVNINYDALSDLPFAFDADELNYNDLPCEESTKTSICTTSWKVGGDAFISLELEKYSMIKFYIKSIDNGYMEIKATENTEKNLLTISPVTKWHEFVLEQNGDFYDLIVDGTEVGFSLSDNLNELSCLFGDNKKYNFSELFGAEDPDYEEPTYVSLSTSCILNAETTETNEVVAPEYSTKSYCFEPTVWTKVDVLPLNLTQYKKGVFYVKNAIAEKWFAVEVGTTNILAFKEAEVWHKIEFNVVKGYANILVDGTQKATITDLTQLKASFTENGKYYISEIYGVVNDSYEGVELTAASGTGYTVSVNKVGIDAEGKATLNKGTVVTFGVALLGGYDMSEITVKANGTAIQAEENVYSITIDEDTVITVEGVTKNTGDKNLGDYVKIADCAMNETGEETTDIVEATMSSKSTKITKTWTATPNAVFATVNEAQYTELKYFVKATKTDKWFELLVNDASTSLAFDGKTDLFREIRFTLEDGGTWSVSLDGKNKVNGITSLSEVTYKLSGDFYVSELFGIVDPDYVAPIYVSLSTSCILNAETTETNEVVAPEYSTKSYCFEPTAWTKVDVLPLNLTQYKKGVFYVKNAIAEKWFAVEVGTTNILAFKEAEVWHKIEFNVVKGYANILVDGTQKATITDLTQLKASFTENGKYYISEIYGVVNDSYEGVELTAASGTGYNVSVNIVCIDAEGKSTLNKGTVVTFGVALLGGYDMSEITVKANGTAIQAEDNVYSITVNEDTVITVEGVTQNTGDKNLGDYVKIADCAMNETGEEITDIVETTMSSKSTKITKTWSATANTAFATVNETQYSELKYFVKATKTGEWFELLVNGASTSLAFDGKTDLFREIRFTLEDGGTWSVSLDGKNEVNGITSLSEVTYKLSGDFYVSELFGIVEE